MSQAKTRDLLYGDLCLGYITFESNSVRYTFTHIKKFTCYISNLLRKNSLISKTIWIFPWHRGRPLTNWATPVYWHTVGWDIFHYSAVQYTIAKQKESTDGDHLILTQNDSEYEN